MNIYLSNKIKNISLLLMIMVVFLHSYNLDTKGLNQVLVNSKNFIWMIQNFISYGVTRIAVPFFFVISGFLFVFDGKISFLELVIKIKKRIRTVFVPFITWSLLGICFYLFLQQIPQTKFFFTNKLIYDYTIRDFFNVLIYKPIPYQLWFLRDLMVLMILSPLILYLIKSMRVILFTTVLVFWLLNYDSVFLTSEALLFFLAGITISENFKYFLEIKIKNLSLPIIWLFLLIMQLVCMFYDLKALSILCSKFAILIGIPSLWILYDVLSENFTFERKIEKITWATFFIYVFHEPFLSFIKKITFFVLGKNSIIIFINYFIAPIIVITISVFFAYFLKATLPVIYKILTGGR
ncbi:acyltransferase family protein [Flavobacterium ardleyense]|uniref:Acyltransferase family protein n=1 Tax=Flavobacterium ardleyense TaxID=2038737 RepID=A0ABW5Z6V0_9FLAO